MEKKTIILMIIVVISILAGISYGFSNSNFGNVNITGNLTINGTVNNITTNYLTIVNSPVSCPTGQFITWINGNISTCAYPTNSTNFVVTNTLNISGSQISPMNIITNISGYSQLQMQNIRNDSVSSSDFVATANNGDASNFYLDCGINNQLYNDTNWTITTGNDGYCYVQNGSFELGTSSANKIMRFFTGGQLTANVRMTIDDAFINITGRMTATGAINASTINATNTIQIPSVRTGCSVASDAGKLFYNTTIQEGCLCNTTAWVTFSNKSKVC